MSRLETVTLAQLEIDAEQTAAEIQTWLREVVHGSLRRKGAVVGVSGGIDSAVVAALCARAFGPDRVCGLLMPEADSAPETLALSRLAAGSQGIEPVVEDVTDLLTAAGCYRRRDEAVRTAVPEYGPGWKMKIVLPELLGSERLRVFSLVAEGPAGERVAKRLSAEAYLAILAATNFKQRTRKMLEYYYADRLVYAVAGTPNRLEYDQGFYVKNGDGAADVKPIAHLYKTQVYRLAEYLDVPEPIRARPPTTDTYSLPQSQEEFYFSVSHEQLDLCLYAHNERAPAAAVAEAAGLDAEDVERVYRDIERKQQAAHYLNLEPQLVVPLGGAHRPPAPR